MYSFYVENEKNIYELCELGKMFVTAETFEIRPIEKDGEIPDGGILIPAAPDLSRENRNAQKRWLYDWFSALTGKSLDWGILTGVRPSKLFRELSEKSGVEETQKAMKQQYYLSDAKIKLLTDTLLVQRTVISDEDPKAAGVYVGIPFCPTRCLYCSFTSNKITKNAAVRYMEALEKEIKETARIMKDKGLYAESVYIGGGTPTSLDDEDFEHLLALVKEYLVCGKTSEFTVECGRPDTINRNKLSAIKKYGADRISINPQTMKAETLKLIGREHSPEQIVEAYKLARECGIEMINMDLITGLPEETPEDFEKTLDAVMALEPENITVHTLAVKKASRLIERDKDYNFRQGETVRRMLEIASTKLDEGGYKPYYLYRQKHMAGNFENVGYCRSGAASVYNIRIMEENQTIIALGAGGISKVYYPAENRLERVANVSNYEIYIDRIDEMIRRKEEGLI